MTPPSLIDLANRIAGEIRRRGLEPGDACPSTRDVARRLGVSTQAANNALRILVKRGLLLRRQRRGTRVAPSPRGASPRPLRRVHLLVHEEYLRTEGLLADGVVIGIQDELPGTEIRFDFLPASDADESIRRTLDDALRSPLPEGFVMVRAPLDVQRRVRASGLPAVVFGSLHPSVEGLPWIERDQAQIAELLARHFLARRCRRVVALFRDRMGPGDVVALDRLQAVLAGAGLRLTDFALRCLPPDVDAVRQAVLPLLNASRRPVGFFCRSLPLAEGAAAAARAARRRIGRDVEIAVTDVSSRDRAANPPYPTLRTAVSPEEIGRRIARLLRRQAAGERVEPDHEILPVTLDLPDDKAPRRPSDKADR
jgi:DNA-binding LacI/PurR family transcriptional regulator